MRLRSRIFYSYTLLVILYTLISLLPGPDKATLVKYHLHPAALRLLDLTLLVPIFLIWFAVFYGYEKLNRYGQLIKSNHDGEQVAKLAKGLLALAIGLPLSSIASELLRLIARHHAGFTGPSTIITNYLTIFYLLVAFIFINKGARGLREFSKTRPSFRMTNVVVLAVIILGVIFCDLIAKAHHNLITTFHMSYSLVMLTLAIPYMYLWFIGLLAISEMYIYSRQVSGVVYRKGWNRLAFGLGSIIAIDILLQYLNTLTGWINGLSLAKFLLVLYVLLFALAAAFIVVALGTKQLMKIEEA